jgi:hypothetical protein
MRRTYISPEFTYDPVPGTLNMREIKFPFGSKMMEIEDRIDIFEDTIFWYENSSSEQINFISESSGNPKTVNLVQTKANLHQLYLQKNQSQLQKESNARWVVEVDYLKILEDYIFARIKESRTFEGVTSTDTLSQNVDVSIREYIDYNIKSRYNLQEVLFWTKYTQIVGSTRLQYGNLYDSSIKLEIFKNRQFSTSFLDKKLRIEFNQQQPAVDWVFDYYFSFYFTKV